MHILISNDDGIDAPGIKALAQKLSEDNKVTVVAPSREQSGVGHSITYSSPIYSRSKSFPVKGVTAYAVDGSPVDCVKFAACVLLKEKIDLVVSGINQGSNIGVDIFPSGTVNAAIAGVLQGIPSIAVSLADFESDDFSACAELAAKLVRFVEDHPVPHGVLLNLNVPALPLNEIKGVCVVPMDSSGYPFHYETRKNPAKREYHWLVCDRVVSRGDEMPANDCDAMDRGYASITPLKIDLSDYEYMEELKRTGLFL